MQEDDKKGDELRVWIFLRKLTPRSVVNLPTDIDYHLSQVFTLLKKKIYKYPFYCDKFIKRLIDN